jgi:prevent-host-death family protein
MRTINIHQAKTHLSRLVEDAAKGEEIVIAKAGKPVARLVALPAPERRAPKFDTLKDAFTPADDWDSPETNEAIWAEFWEKMETEEW